MLQYLANRLSEKSTWTSLGVLSTVIGWKIAPGMWDSIAMVGMGIGSLIGAAIPSTVMTKNISGSVAEIPKPTRE